MLCGVSFDDVCSSYALAPKLVLREASNQGSQGGEAAEDLQLREKMFSIDRKMHALQQVTSRLLRTVAPASAL